MNWLNLETNELRAPEFLTATALERGVWLSLLLHSVAVENGGRLVGAVDWTTRQWMVVCGLEKEEVLDEAGGLWKIEGDDVVVWGYPHSVQRGLEARRENGKKGGRPAQSGPGKADENQDGNRTETERKPSVNLTGTIKKGKVREREEKEKEGKVLPGADAPAEQEAAELSLEGESVPILPLGWTRETGWQGVTEELTAELSLAFPACDIRRQFLVMDQWLKSNPAKVKSNWRRFITNWLKSEQDKGGDLRASSQGFGQKKNEGGGAAAVLASPTGKEPEWDWRRLYAEIWGQAPTVGWFELAKSVRHELRTAWNEKNGRGGAA